MDGKDDSLDGEDREEWDRAWSARTLRSLPGECKLDLQFARWLPLKVAPITIAADPPEFAARGWRESDVCPVCGESTLGSVRIAACLYVAFENLEGDSRGFKFGVGVWAHQSCFESCPDTGRPAGIPW